jgi:GDPmannose 4,6-dehydratase
MNRKALVTGVSGQDGRYLCERLVADGVDVHALANSDEDAPDGCPPEVALHDGNLRDIVETRALVLEVAPDEIYNLAAMSSVGKSWECPELTGTINGTAAVGMMESARLVQERTGRTVRFVQASSAEIFGQPPTSPQDEHTPIRPINPYGAAKAYAHLMVDVYRTRGLHASSLILYNHESPLRPPTFVTRKITAAVAAIARGGTERLVLGNLEARRDWGWAPDYVDAMIVAALSDDADDYVIATGEAHSVGDFVTVAFQHAGIDDWEPLVETHADLHRPAEAAELVGDAGKAMRELGWKPTVGFHELVGRMVDADLAILDRL